MSDEVRTEKKNEPLADTALRDCRDARLRVLQGSLADIPFTSDAFARKKQEEIAREEQKCVRLFPDAQ